MKDLDHNTAQTITRKSLLRFQQNFLMYMQLNPHVRQVSRELGVSRHNIDKLLRDTDMSMSYNVHEILLLFLQLPRLVDENEV